MDARCLEVDDFYELSDFYIFVVGYTFFCAGSFSAILIIKYSDLDIFVVFYRCLFVLGFGTEKKTKNKNIATFCTQMDMHKSLSLFLDIEWNERIVNVSDKQCVSTRA